MRDVELNYNRICPYNVKTIEIPHVYDFAGALLENLKIRLMKYMKANYDWLILFIV